MAFIAECLISLLFNVVFYSIGRLIIPVLSLGHARAENVREIFYERTFVYSRRDGKVSFSEPATSLIGLAFLILLAILYHYMSK